MNPIQSINGVAVPTPSKYKIGIQDVSLPGAGRTMDGTMHTKKITQKVKLELSWRVLSFPQGQQLLALTGNEYFNVTFLGKNGTFETKQFYRGDVDAELYGEPVNKWVPFSFNVIER